MQVCEVAHLQRLVVSTDAGAWGGDHARRRSVELQVGPSSLSSRASHVFEGAWQVAVGYGFWMGCHAESVMAQGMTPCPLPCGFALQNDDSTHNC